jgi:hypothetical protein
MSKKKLVDKYADRIKPLVFTNPGQTCVDRLENLGLKGKVFPTHDEILNFITSAEKTLSEANNDDFRCILKQVTKMNQQAKKAQSKKLISRSRKKFKELFEKRQYNKTGSGTLRIAAPVKFIGFRERKD